MKIYKITNHFILERQSLSKRKHISFIVEHIMNPFIILLLIILLFLFLYVNKETFINQTSTFYYPNPDTCQALTYPFSITDRWWNPSALAWEDANPSLTFDVCRIKTSTQELGESNCSTCTTCGMLIDGFNTKHCVPADPATSLPKNTSLRNMYLKNKQHYIWAYKNRLHREIPYSELTIS